MCRTPLLTVLGLLGIVAQTESRAASAIHGVVPVLVTLAGPEDSKLPGIWAGHLGWTPLAVCPGAHCPAQGQRFR